MLRSTISFKCLHIVLVSSGNHTHVEIQAENSQEKIISYRSSGRNQTYAYIPCQCDALNVGSIPDGGPIIDDEFFSILEFQHVYNFHSILRNIYTLIYYNVE